MPDRPNVVFVMCDQLRGDALGCYGHPVVETPHLDQLAHQGVRFSRTYTATPSCIPARAGLLTGMCQRNHGRVGYKDGVPWNYEHTLAGEMAAAGYHTQAVGKMHVYPARNLMGFHNVVLHDGYLHFEHKAAHNYALVDDYTPWLRSKIGSDADMILHGMNANSWVARPWHYSEDVHPTTWATTMAIDFLRRATRRSRSSCSCHMFGRIRRSIRPRSTSISTSTRSFRRCRWATGRTSGLA